MVKTSSGTDAVKYFLGSTQLNQLYCRPFIESRRQNSWRACMVLLFQSEVNFIWIAPSSLIFTKILNLYPHGSEMDKKATLLFQNLAAKIPVASSVRNLFLRCKKFMQGPSLKDVRKYLPIFYPPSPVSEFSDSPPPEPLHFLKNQHHSIMIIFVNFLFVVIYSVIYTVICKLSSIF